MKWLCFSLFLFYASFSFSQDKEKAKFFPDTLHSVGTSGYYQKEDIYSFFTFQTPVVKDLYVEAGVGFGWRQIRTNSKFTPSFQFGFHYDFIKKPKVFLGPALRLHYQGSSLGDENVAKFRYYGANFGYRFAFGNKLKIVNSGFIGPHQFWYGSGESDNKVVYFGYAFQIGLNYEL